MQGLPGGYDSGQDYSDYDYDTDTDLGVPADDKGYDPDSDVDTNMQHLSVPSFKGRSSEPEEMSLGDIRDAVHMSADDLDRIDSKLAPTAAKVRDATARVMEFTASGDRDAARVAVDDLAAAREEAKAIGLGEGDWASRRIEAAVNEAFNEGVELGSERQAVNASIDDVKELQAEVHAARLAGKPTAELEGQLRGALQDATDRIGEQPDDRQQGLQDKLSGAILEGLELGAVRATDAREIEIGGAVRDLKEAAANLETASALHDTRPSEQTEGDLEAAKQALGGAERAFGDLREKAESNDEKQDLDAKYTAAIDGGRDLGRVRAKEIIEADELQMFEGVDGVLSDSDDGTSSTDSDVEVQVLHSAPPPKPAKLNEGDRHLAADIITVADVVSKCKAGTHKPRFRNGVLTAEQRGKHVPTSEKHAALKYMAGVCRSAAESNVAKVSTEDGETIDITPVAYGLADLEEFKGLKDDVAAQKEIKSMQLSAGVALGGIRYSPDSRTLDLQPEVSVGGDYPPMSIDAMVDGIASGELDQRTYDMMIVGGRMSGPTFEILGELDVIVQGLMKRDDLTLEQKQAMASNIAKFGMDLVQAGTAIPAPGSGNHPSRAEFKQVLSDLGKDVNLVGRSRHKLNHQGVASSGRKLMENVLKLPEPPSDDEIAVGVQEMTDKLKGGDASPEALETAGRLIDGAIANGFEPTEQPLLGLMDAARDACPAFSILSGSVGDNYRDLASVLEADYGDVDLAEFDGDSKPTTNRMKLTGQQIGDAIECEILNAPAGSQTRKVISRAIDVADRAYKEGNLQLSSAIIASVNKGSVTRLRDWQRTSGSKKEKSARLMSVIGSSTPATKAYRAAVDSLAAKGKAVVPQFDRVIQEATNSGENNPAKNDDGTLNIGGRLALMSRFKTGVMTQQERLQGRTPTRGAPGVRLMLRAHVPELPDEEGRWALSMGKPKAK